MARRTLGQALVLVLVAVALGAASARLHPVLDWKGNDLDLVRHDVARIAPEAAAAALDDARTLFLDVRSAAEFDAGHVRGAVAFSAEDFDAAYDAIRDFLDPELRLIVYGDEPLPAVRGAQYLEARGFAPRVLEGGWATWKARRMPVEEPGSPEATP